jgi:hypothetical protein
MAEKRLKALLDPAVRLKDLIEMAPWLAWPASASSKAFGWRVVILAPS